MWIWFQSLASEAATFTVISLQAIILNRSKMITMLHVTSRYGHNTGTLSPERRTAFSLL